MSKEKKTLEDAYDEDAIELGEPDNLKGIMFYSKKDARSFFEQGAAWQREHSFNPHHMNAIEAAKEATARWPE
jgi:hypothetical protein